LEGGTLPKIDGQTAVLVLQIITFLVTIVGWIYTGAQQKSILRESRQYQRKDRDLAVYRARMDRASELTKSLIETSDKWYLLASLAKATIDEGKTQEFQALGFSLLQQAVGTRINLAFILYDPQFRTLRDILRPEVAKKLYDSLKTSSSQIQVFHDNTYYMQPTDPNIKDKVRLVFEDGKKIGDKLVATADLFADAFAELDQSLTKDT
jgi:hypothetical protein